MQNQRPKEHLSTEQGTIAVIAAILLPALLAVVALVLDNNREQYSAVSIQNAADAAALAAVSQLDGSLSGWLASKRSAIHTLERNPIFGASDDYGSSLALEDGFLDPYETDDNFKGSEADLSSIEIKVERGAYWFKENKWTFVSFEDAEEDDPNDPTRRLMQGVDSYLLANAIKIEIRLKGLKIAIGDAIGMRRSSGTKRHAIAVTDVDNLEDCIFPAAIMACDRMFSLDSSAPYTDRDFAPEKQCNRQVFITETNPESDEERREGFYRTKNYSLRYLQNNRRDEIEPNNWTISSDAIFGQPSNGPESQPASVDGLISALSRRCIKAKVGQTFDPLETTSGFLDSNAVDDAIGDIITHRSNRSFSQIFCGGRECIPGNTKPNFPYSRDTIESTPPDRTETTLAWPFGEGYGVMFMADKGRVDPINPLCHSPRVGTDEDRPVAKVKVAVIAPSDSDENAYCDFTNLVQGQRPQIVLPTSDTNPVIVGFTEMYLYDYNVAPLNNPVPGAKDPESIPASMVGDDWEDFLEEVSSYSSDHANWRNQCVDDCGEPCEGEDDPEGCNPDYDTCCEDGPTPPSPNVSGDKEWIPECFKLDGWPFQPGIEADWPATDEEYATAQETYINNIQEFINNDSAIEIKPDKTGCLPIRRPGAYPVSDAANYDAPRVLSPGNGCGGIVAKLSCNRNQTPYGTVPKHRQQGTLVK